MALPAYLSLPHENDTTLEKYLARTTPKDALAMLHYWKIRLNLW